MQKWEYLTIYVYNMEDGKEHTERVTFENNRPLHKGKHPQAKDYPKFVDYISQRGEEGWEMVGISSPQIACLYVAFKRPKS